MERQEQLLELLRKDHQEQQDQLQQKLSTWFAQQEVAFAREKSYNSQVSVSGKKQAHQFELPNTPDVSCMEIDDLPTQADLTPPQADATPVEGLKSALAVGHVNSELSYRSKGQRVTLNSQGTVGETVGFSGTDSVKTPLTPAVSARGSNLNKAKDRSKGRSRLSRMDSMRRSALRKKGDVKTNMLMDEFYSDPENSIHPSTLMRYIVDHAAFDFVTGFILIANVVVIGYEVEYKAKNMVDTTPDAVQVLEYIFAALFTIELICRIAADGLKKYFITGDVNWNWLDFLIVVFTLVEISVRFLVGEGGAFDNAAVLRAIRLIRIVRVMRVIRVMKFFKSLRLLVAAVMHTVKTCVWTVMLLAIVLYTFGIVFTQAATEEIINEYETSAKNAGTTVRALVGALTVEDSIWHLKHRYGGLHETMLTLYMSTTGGLDWDVALEPMKFSVVYELLFLGFISFVFFAVLNVVTGIFCQFAIEMARADSADIIKEQLEQKAVFIENLKKLFKEWGVDEHEEISLNQFEAHLDDEHMRAFLKHIGIDSDDAWSLFNLLDRDKGGSIDIDEFVDGCLRLRGPAMQIQLAKLQYEQKFFGDTLADMVEDLGLQVTTISTEIGAVTSSLAKLARKVEHGDRRSPTSQHRVTECEAPKRAGYSRRMASGRPPPPGVHPGAAVLPGGVPETLETGSDLQATLSNALTWEPGAPVEV
mmetsp:Transcript_19200/g.44856  ORF Transcript_19200/g.44856 Transcript_19200/m.44856 type:complete len:703 (+) Transcript_19200:2-2110(+)